MEWLFLTAVLVLFVYHRTFRYVVILLAFLAGLGLGIVLLVTSGFFAWDGWPPVVQASFVCLVALLCGSVVVKLLSLPPITAPPDHFPSPTPPARPLPALPGARSRQ